MENFSLHAIAKELQAVLAGQRLGRAYQIGTTDLYLDFRLRDGRGLMISTDPQRLAIYLTSRTIKQFEIQPRIDTNFALLTKKHLSSARIIAIDHLGYDRVLHINFQAEDEGGHEISRSMVIELTGPSANVLIVEQRRIIAELRERKIEVSDAPPSTGEMNRSESNDLYSDPEPPANKIDPFECPPEKLHAIIEQSSGMVAAAARKYLIGFGPLYAQELTARAKTLPAEIALQNLLDDLFNREPAPRVYSSAPLEEMHEEVGADNFAVVFSPIELIHQRERVLTHFASVNEAADVCFSLLAERAHFISARQQLNSTLAARLKKQRTLLVKLKQERDRFARDEQAQRFGELLLANAHHAVKVENVFLVTDYYDPEQATIEIPATEFATVQEAAEHYFKLARKARSGLASLSERVPEIEREIAQIESNLAQLQSVTTQARLAALSESMGLKPAPKRTSTPAQQTAKYKKPVSEKISGVRRYRSSDGYEILVGRTSRDNDYLTMRLAKSFDIWFHTADYPGSHVILRNPKRREVPMRAITEAAQLAAKFSHARADSRVAVNYCERKFVTKPKGFAIGQVRLSSFKTILVEPHEAGERIL